MLNQFALHHHKALVTGASRGIGRAIAVGLAEAGADVALLARSPQLEETASRCREAGGRTLSLRKALPRDEEEAKQLIDEVVTELGGLDILVNVAGINHRFPSEDFPLDRWDEVLDTNLRAVFLLCRFGGHQMLQRGKGKIINIASLLSFSGGLNVPAYAASKGAVAQLTKALANEWAARNVNVNAIAPGYIETDMTRPLKEDPQRGPQISSRIPAGRWGYPEELVGPTVFLASDASNYIHGHILLVDGGWMAR